ncbi:23S rRNA (uracil(1939)-C(5))-methyltransferase RlmD [Aurantivibrio infirmus]
MSGAPAKKGEIFTATVRDLASDGRGILSHPSGLTIFAAGVWPGETGNFRFTGLRKKIGSAELVQLSDASPFRTSAPCPHHGNFEGDCGGCPWQFIDYKQQLAAKQRRIEKVLSFVPKETIQEIIPAPDQLQYRNRAQFKTNGEEIGFLSAQSHALAPINDCIILSEKNRKTLRDLRSTLPNRRWNPGKNQKWTTIDIDESVDQDGVAVNSRLPFRQSNDKQNEKMREWLKNKLKQWPSSGTALELFCGSGNFTDVIAAENFDQVIAVDAVGEATQELTDKHLANVKVVNANLYIEGAFPKIYSADKTSRNDITTLILDPPREGLKNTEGLFRKKHRIENIFYISCDLATFARDLKYFHEQGFKAREIQAIDISPHTPHVELLAHLSRKK